MLWRRSNLRPSPLGLWIGFSAQVTGAVSFLYGGETLSLEISFGLLYD